MKRILAIDFGLERVGIAISDELHIAITPHPTLLYNNPNFWQQLINIIKSNNIGSVVIGVPYEENEEHPLCQHIEKFQTILQNFFNDEKINIPIYHQDESFTSIEAMNVMIEIGKKKKQRAKKGNKDKVAAVLILRNFMETI